MNVYKNGSALWIALLLLSWPASVLATKPCPSHPCQDGSGGFNAANCEALADWVATGTISEVRRDPHGHPLLKDFASFSFTPEKFEKGAPFEGAIRYTVGWCYNRTEVPDDYSGKFRLYGLLEKTTDGKSKYLQIESAR